MLSNMVHYSNKLSLIFIAVVLSAITTVFTQAVHSSIQVMAQEEDNGEPDIPLYAQNQTQITNFTQLFSTSEEFQQCIEGLSPCLPTVIVLYEDPTLLVLKSSYVDAIWKGVALAQKEGYKIDAMTSYAAGRIIDGSDITLLVAMSK
jgi:hypothetical protein